MTDCPQCEYHKNRAARWRAEAYRQAGHDVIELPWVGLTDEEVLDMARTFGAQPWPPNSCAALGKMIEAKLKERNTCT